MFVFLVSSDDHFSQINLKHKLCFSCTKLLWLNIRKHTFINPNVDGVNIDIHARYRVNALFRYYRCFFSETARVSTSEESARKNDDSVIYPKRASVYFCLLAVKTCLYKVATLS